MELAEVLASAARALAGQQSLGETMTQVARLATEVVPGVDAAGVSVLDRGARISGGRTSLPTRSVVTDAFAGACEALQARLGQGPAVARELGDDVVVVDDLARHPRWPDVTVRLRRLGVHAVVACHLPAARSAPARLILYARQPLPPAAPRAAALYAVHAAIALDHAARLEHLNIAMTTRERIGQAIGVLMNRHRLGPERVFEVLVRVSQELNVKLRELAEIVLETAVDPAEVADLARRAAKDAGARADELRDRRTALRTAVRPPGESLADAERRARLAAARAVYRLSESVAPGRKGDTGLSLSADQDE